MMNPGGRPLYEWLGGSDALAAAVDDVIPRLHGDPQIGTFKKGQATHTKARGRQMLLDVWGQAFGGPAVYHGPGMNAAHQGLGIPERDWTAMEHDVVAALDAFGVQGQEGEECLAAAGRLKGDGVQGR